MKFLGIIHENLSCSLSIEWLVQGLKLFTNILTYIIGHHNSSVRIIDIVYNTTFVVCVNLYIIGGPYYLKSPPYDIFFEKFFMEILFTLRVFTRNLLVGNRR